MDIEIETYMKSINLENVCRACLSECDEMTSLFTEMQCMEEDDEISFIYQMLMHVSSIQVLAIDGLPTLICKNCIESANNAFKFKMLCDRSESLLQTYVSHFKIKTEANLERREASESSDKDILEPTDDTKIVLFNETNKDKHIVYLKFKSNSAIVDGSIIDDELLSSNCANNEVLIESDENTIELNCTEMQSSRDRMLGTTDSVKTEMIDLDESSVNFELVGDKLKMNDSNGASTAHFETIKNDALLMASSEENAKLRERIVLKKKYAQMNSSNGCKMRKKRSYFHPYRLDEKGEKRYKCLYCNKEYKHSTSLTVHIRSHTMERPYLCTLCGKGFKQYTGLNNHMRSHSGEQPYACTLCNKRYRQSASLTAHIRIHTGQRPFLCSVCGKGFRQAPDLGYHMRTHTKEKPYMCNICGKQMSMQSHLVQHMRTHTGEKPYPCNKCGKAFASSTRLKRHEIIHTDLKPYSCDVCKKSFNRASTLRVHAITHTNDRPHVCKLCGKGFIQAYCLRSHMKIHN